MTDKEYTYCYNNYFKPVRSYLMMYCNDKEQCEDITQDAFIKLWEKREHIRFSTVRQWLHAITYNQMIDHLRRQKHKFRYAVENYSEGEEDGTPAYDVWAVLDEVEKLPQLKRDLLLDRMIGTPYKELCEKYDINMTTLKAQLHSARKMLNNKINYYGEQ